MTFWDLVAALPKPPSPETLGKVNALCQPDLGDVTLDDQADLADNPFFWLFGPTAHSATWLFGRCVGVLVQSPSPLPSATKDNTTANVAADKEKKEQKEKQSADEKESKEEKKEVKADKGVVALEKSRKWLESRLFSGGFHLTDAERKEKLQTEETTSREEEEVRPFSVVLVLFVVHPVVVVVGEQ